MQSRPSIRSLLQALLLGSAILFTARIVHAHGGGGGGHGSAGHGTSHCGKSKGHAAGSFGSNTFDHFSPTPNAAEHAGRAAGAADDTAIHAQGANPSSASDAGAQERYEQRSGDGD